MDFSDFFSDMAIVGGDRGGWRSYFVIVILVLGAGTGGYLGYTSNGIAGAIGYGAIGCFLGWFLGVVLLGFFRFLLIFVPLFLIVMAAIWVTGGFS